MIRDRIPYEGLVQGALRGVIRQVLADVAANGLPGEHHFYITFHTHIAGVEMSPALKERYPDHVTIVLQNQFWDLSVDDEAFSVTLSFSDVPERLVVPFMAVQAFYDPVASFEASFDAIPQIPIAVTPISAFALKDRQGNGQQGKQNNSKESPPKTLPINAKKTTKLKRSPQQTTPAPDKLADLSKEKTKSADVVSLDAFRKK